MPKNITMILGGYWLRMGHTFFFNFVYSAVKCFSLYNFYSSAGVTHEHCIRFLIPIQSGVFVCTACGSLVN